MIVFRDVTELDLLNTLDCGQSFRWTQLPDGSFSGVAFKKSVRVTLEGGSLIIDGADEAVILICRLTTARSARI